MADFLWKLKAMAAADRAITPKRGQSQPGTLAERLARSWLRFSSDDPQGGRTFKLSDPLQITIIDALADALDMPYK